MISSVPAFNGLHSSRRVPDPRLPSRDFPGAFCGVIRAPCRELESGRGSRKPRTSAAPIPGTPKNSYLVFGEPLAARRAPSILKRLWDRDSPLRTREQWGFPGGDRGVWGVARSAVRGGRPTIIRRVEGVPRRELESVGGSRSDTAFYSLLFILFERSMPAPTSVSSRRRSLLSEFLILNS